MQRVQAHFGKDKLSGFQERGRSVREVNVLQVRRLYAPQSQSLLCDRWAFVREVRAWRGVAWRCGERLVEFDGVRVQVSVRHERRGVDPHDLTPATLPAKTHHFSR